jgi:4-hydroxy-3-methylbut-2-enyl diphosphate reductase
MTIDETQAPTSEETTETVVETSTEAVAAQTPDEPAAEEASSSTESTPNESVPAPAVEAPVAPVVATPAVSEPEGVTTLNDADLFEQYMNAMGSGESDASSDSSVKRLAKGDRIEATVVHVEADKIFVDLGAKAEGVIPMNEFSETVHASLKDVVKPGDKLNVVVIKTQGSDGNPIVSRKQAEFEEQWDRIVRSFEDGSSINAMVVDRVKGGLVVDVGVRGFVPATHVGNGKLRNIDKYVGQNLVLKVIELDRDRKKVVLSNRQAEEETRTAARGEIFKNIKVGDIVTGTVRRLTDYGAFVDLGGVDGLLHISEMSWARIAHPKEMFKDGQEIQVMVLRLDQGVGKISLGHRQVLPDPWNLIKQNYKIGQNLTVKLGRLVTSGAFVKLDEGAEAFLPLSEMSNRRLRKPQEVAEEGQEVEVQIIDLRPDERRMVLSMRALGGGGEARTSYVGEEEFRKPRSGGAMGAKTGRRRPNDDGDDSRRGTATGGATIGERLGALKGLLKPSAEEEAAE